MATFKIVTEFITLGQLLKAAGFAGSGTDAKMILEEGGITVNGEEDNRRGRKLYPGDTIRLKDGNQVSITS